MPGALEYGGPYEQFDPYSLILNIHHSECDDRRNEIVLTITRGQCIHSDTVRGPLRRKPFREVGHSTLG